MKTYRVTANGTCLGYYNGDVEQDARDLCAQDAGYKSECDMVAQIEQPSDLQAILVDDLADLAD